MSFLPTFLLDSLDEVVFEGRNQAYGAYQLRHGYQRNLLSAAGITLLLGAFLAVSWVSWQRLAPVAPPLAPVTHTLEPILVPTLLPIEQPKAAAPASAPTRVITHATPAIATQVAKDDVVQPRPTPPAVSEVVEDIVGPAAPNMGSASTSVSEADGKTDGTDTSTTAPSATNTPFISVEKMPEFAGGQEALLRYLRSHLRYPSAALAAGIGGRVFLSFVIQADGSISEVTVLKGLGYGLDDEAQRVVRQMPNWTPGYQSKHPVAVRFTLPITFQYQ